MPIETVIGMRSIGLPARVLPARIDRHRHVADRRTEPLGDDRAAVRVGLRQQHHELLAALPERHVDLAQPDPQPPGELAQHGVPGRVPVRVVDLLEVVQVEHQHGEHPAEPAGPLHLAAQRFAQVAVVPQPGERVGQREPLRLLVHADVVHGHPGLPGERPQRRAGRCRRTRPRRAGRRARARPACTARRVGLAGRPPTAGAQIGTATYVRHGGSSSTGPPRPQMPAPRLAGRRDRAEHTLAERHPQRRQIRLGHVPAAGQPYGAAGDEPAVRRVDEQHHAGPRAGRGQRGLQDDLQDPVQVVGAGQGVAEDGEMAAELVAAGGQRLHVRLQLAGHPVERAGQPARARRRARPAPGCPVRRSATRSAACARSASGRVVDRASHRAASTAAAATTSRRRRAAARTDRPGRGTVRRPPAAAAGRAPTARYRCMVTCRGHPAAWCGSRRLRRRRGRAG